MQPIWNRAQFKQTGKDTFLSNYWPFVGVCVLLAPVQPSASTDLS